MRGIIRDEVGKQVYSFTDVANAQLPDGGRV